MLRQRRSQGGGAVFREVLGGVGLFLLGMMLLTDGLKALAGASLHRLLAGFTGNRISALLSGTLLTALVQSSSATTLATIGFVSAGLIGLEGAIGVVLGANLGTTSTGWLVSLLGLKLSVGKMALPLIGAGALLRLLTRERAANLGLALSGFGLIFVGIDLLQVGMEDLAEHVDLSRLQATGVGGRALLVAIGLGMTVVMQSSSAAMATTLTALHAGHLDLEQSAALAIGQNVGTTVTALLGSLGAPTAARRTAAAHVGFNLATGVVAFAILGPATRALQLAGDVEPALQLAAFHTGFNVLGIALFLPFVPAYARLLERLLVERGPRLARHLAPQALAVPSLALAAAERTLREALGLVAGGLAAVLARSAGGGAGRGQLKEVLLALAALRDFLGQIHGGPGRAGQERLRHVELLHCVDHLERLCEAGGEEVPYGDVATHPDVVQATTLLTRVLEEAGQALEAGGPLPIEGLAQTSQQIANDRRARRPALLEATAEGWITPREAGRVLEAVRWLDRLGYHLWRCSTHLHGAEGAPAEGAPDAPLPSAPPAP